VLTGRRRDRRSAASPHVAGITLHQKARGILTVVNREDCPLVYKPVFGASASVTKMTATTDATILIVDDSPENLHVLGELLRPRYRVLASISGESALRVAGG